jgi:hypothetical protein
VSLALPLTAWSDRGSPPQHPSALLTGLLLALLLHGLVLGLWPSSSAVPSPLANAPRSQVVTLRLLPAPQPTADAAGPDAARRAAPTRADAAHAAVRQDDVRSVRSGAVNPPERPQAGTAIAPASEAAAPVVPAATDAAASAPRGDADAATAAASGSAQRPLDLRWRGGPTSAGVAQGPRWPAAPALAHDPPTGQSAEARLARALDPGTARSEQRLAGEGRTRVRIGRDCLDVKDARSAQLDPFNQSQQQTARLVSDCGR